MATFWKSQQSEGEYSLQFETDDKEKYKLVEKAAQMAMDGKTVADIEEVKHGHWIVMRGCVQATFECSECGFSFTNADPTEECVYFGCPICLAKMDEGSECHGKQQQT